MLTIVFAGMGNPRTGYDLYLAKRGKVSEPFGKPEVVKACVSPETDAYPTMTADGLELFFVRSDANPQLYYSTRETTSADFGDPVHWSVPATPGIDPAKRRTDFFQFVDPLRLAFYTVNLTTNGRRYLLAEGADRKSQFASTRELPFSDPWPMYCVARKGSVAIWARKGGSSFPLGLVRAPFGKETLILDAPRRARSRARFGFRPKKRHLRLLAGAGQGSWLGQETLDGADLKAVSPIIDRDFPHGFGGDVAISTTRVSVPVFSMPCKHQGGR